MAECRVVSAHSTHTPKTEQKLNEALIKFSITILNKIKKKWKKSVWDGKCTKKKEILNFGWIFKELCTTFT